MPEQMPPSEFGGRPMRNGVQPPPHIPTASERLSLTYRTGDESGQVKEDSEGVIMSGLLPKRVQEEIRKSAGDLDKGEVWDELKRKADAEVAALKGDAPGG